MLKTITSQMVVEFSYLNSSVITVFSCLKVYFILILSSHHRKYLIDYLRLILKIIIDITSKAKTH